MPHSNKGHSWFMRNEINTAASIWVNMGMRWTYALATVNITQMLFLFEIFSVEIGFAIKKNELGCLDDHLNLATLSNEK